TLPMFYSRQELALRRAVALELIRDDHPWHVLHPLEQLAKELLCRLLVAPLLDEDVQDVVVLIHRTPQVMALTVNRQKHFINGLITNDKFFLIRPTQIQLPWSRQP